MPKDNIEKLDQIVKTWSHQLNNVMTLIQNAAQLLYDDYTGAFPLADDEKHHLLTMLLDNARRSDELTQIYLAEFEHAIHDEA